MSTLQRELERAVQRESLVGAQLTVLSGGTARSAHAGVRDVGTGEPVSWDTRFEIGSVSKPLLAAALLLAESDGLVDLEAPVADAVPEFRPRDRTASRVSARQVLSHTSGLAGDYFPDTGDGADALASFVTLLSEQPLDVAPGTTVSYSNGAYVLAGRLLECVTDVPFGDALAQRLLHPAGADRVGTWGSALDDAASGHELGLDGAPRRATRRFPRALTPAGGVVSSASDLASLVRALTISSTGGLPGWLPQRSRERLAGLADRPGTSLGWGWAVSTSHGELLLAHDGGTYGASSFVRVLPERDVVVALLTARAGVGAAGHALVDAALEDAGVPGVVPPPLTGAVAGAVRDGAGVVGRYRRTGGTVEVGVRDGAPWCVVGTDDEETGPSHHEGRLVLQPSGTWQTETAGGPLTLVFLGSSASATCVVVGARAHTRSACR